MFSKDLINSFTSLKTPFYFYDLDLLQATIEALKYEADKFGFIIHYAVKANANDKILKLINENGLGADCVSGNEISKALEMGFNADDIVFAGVGKKDEEINLGLKEDIFCFNCESAQELGVINHLAKHRGKIANVALRINPNVDAKTHNYITTGLEENKFGINPWELDEVLTKLNTLDYIKLTGLHFHIGSQITDLTVFKGLCIRVNEIQKWFNEHNIDVEHINVGGGYGVDYKEPDNDCIPDFKSFFKIFNDLLEFKQDQKVHFELGRTIVAHCGSLISRVLYIKKGINTNFAILDAGMTELIRPALYQSYHKIENLSSNGKQERYDVVGPICESSDTFGKLVLLPETNRGDFIAIRSAGAYGEVMSSGYNLRDRVKAVYSDEL
jgi:diaminopimelate decarboxylase